MISSVLNNPKRTIHAWSVIGMSSIYCALSLRTAFEPGEIAFLIAVGVLSMVMLGEAIHALMKRESLAQSLMGYAQSLAYGHLGWTHGLMSCALLVSALAIAVQVGSTRTELGLSVVEGIRTGVFFLVGTTAWRLRLGGRLLAVFCWIAADIWVFSAVGVPGVGEGFVILTGALATGWVLVMAQDYLDVCLRP